MITYWREEPPKIKQLAARLGVLRKTFYFAVNGTFMVCHAPFFYDGASNPWPLWWIARPFTSWVVEAGFVHDLFYRCYNLQHFHVWDARIMEHRPLTRWEMDRLFLIIMRRAIKAQGGFRWVQKSRLLKARKLYRGVRTFGGAFLGDGLGELPRGVGRRVDKYNKH